MTEYDRLKYQKEEILQRQREVLERPLLAEIDRLRLECKQLRLLLKRSLQIARPWMDGGITLEKWEQLMDDILREIDRHAR
jgi:hypothetical protein